MARLPALVGYAERMDVSQPRSRGRLWTALGFYALIAVLAAFTLEGKFRLVVWIFMAGLAVKTWLASMQSR
ncbi:MAG TPA: hypothetical protein VFA04_23565 [Bryobacteraceae bacterium]|nr:hypothetical protein [Bryobacteraceae bacterium]